MAANMKDNKNELRSDGAARENCLCLSVLLFVLEQESRGVLRGIAHCPLSSPEDLKKGGK